MGADVAEGLGADILRAPWPHERFAGFVLGGVIQSRIDHASIPLLMAA